jgi:hypothetical protein
MNGDKYLTVITVLRDGRHVIHQTAGTVPGNAGVRIGAHLVLRQRDHGDDVATFVIVHGATVTEHQP